MSLARNSSRGPDDAALETLEQSLPALEAATDLTGLEHVYAEALMLADVTTGRTRKRGQRVAKKAATIVEELRSKGIETDDARQERETMEANETAMRATTEKAQLSERLVALLHLLLNDGSETESMSAFRKLMSAGPDGYLRIEKPPEFETWAPVLVDSYDQSHRIFSAVNASTLQGARRDIERSLKAVAADLITLGAEVRGLATDAVPLIAYALFTERLPVPTEAASASTTEKVNDMILRLADSISAMSTDVRPLFVGFFRLAVLLGEAQSYSEHLGLRGIAIS